MHRCSQAYSIVQNAQYAVLAPLGHLSLLVYLSLGCGGARMARHSWVVLTRQQLSVLVCSVLFLRG